MRVLITGTSSGIGRETAVLFLDRGHTVVGLDKEPSTIEDKNYKHYECDVSIAMTLPTLEEFDIIIVRIKYLFFNFVVFIEQ